MAFDFLKQNVKLYPATLNMISKIVGAIQNETGAINYAKMSGLTPWAYNRIAMVSPTQTTNGTRYFQNNASATGAFVARPTGKNYYNGKFGGFSNPNTYNSSTASPDYGIKQVFGQFDEMVVWFEYQKVSEFLETQNGCKVAKALAVQGQARLTSRALGDETQNVDINGYICPSNWSETGAGVSKEFSDISFNFTNEYDEYYLLKRFYIYKKSDTEGINIRTVTDYRPSIFYLGNSINYFNSSYAKDPPRLSMQAESLLQIVLDGCSLTRGANNRMITTSSNTNEFTFAPMCQNNSTSFQFLLPTAILVDRILDLEKAQPLINENTVRPGTNQYFAMSLNACPIHGNITNHIPLCFINDRVYENDEAVCFTVGGSKYAGLSVSNNSWCALAFKSVDDIVAYFNDWGLKATPNFDEVLYSPWDEIKDSDNPPSPSGGESGTVSPDIPTEDNAEIPSIPNNPDDKIDDFETQNPTVSPINLMNNYALNYTSVKALFNWLCDKSFYDNLSELFTDKLSAIHCLMQYPFDIVAHDPAHCTALSELTIVNVSDNIPCYALVNGYNTILFGGEIHYTSYFGDFRDWKNCKYSVYVPYAGLVEIPPTAVINRTLKLQYCCDLLTGKATAVLKSYENSDTLGALVKTIPCQLGIAIPVQSSNYGQQAINNTLTGISMLSNLAGGIIGAATGNPLSLMNLTGVVQQGLGLMSQPTQYSATGGVSPSTGLSLPQTPYLCISRARPAKPSNFAEINGIPSNIYTTLSNVSSGGALVKMQNVIFKSATATDGEITEITEALNRGVYL